MIKICKITKTFIGKNNAINALYDISLEIKKGEFLSFVGPSGCGKSTLLKICAGLVSPTKGQIVFERDPANTVGIVFQDHTLLPWRSVKQNIALAGEIQKKNLDISKTIDLVGLKQFTDNYPFELSGGMKQRTAIARALVLKPTLLLMDEPFGSLDELMRNKLNMDLLKIWRKMKPSVLFVTHSISEAVLLSDRIVILSEQPGRIKDIVKIKLPRPRLIAMQETKSFQQYVKCIREKIEQKK